jgi:hypothetical protein
MTRIGAIATLLVAFAAAAPQGAGAYTGLLPPTELTVAGGAEAWHPKNSFRLEWKNPDPGSGPALAAVHYWIRDQFGEVVVGEKRIGWPDHVLEGLRVPAPGSYTAEVWLEDAAGNQGAPAAATLRFDNAAPARAAPEQLAGWIGRTAFPYTLRIAHPGEPLPVSGIRGYAVSINRRSTGAPCSGADRCTLAETDLPGGIDDESFVIPQLPEGANYVHTVAVSGSGTRSRVPGMALLRVDETDPVTRLEGVPRGWSDGPVSLTARASDTASGMGPGSGLVAFTAIRVDDAVPTVAWGDSVGATVIGEGIHTIAYYARDAAGNANDGAIVNREENRPPSLAQVQIDGTPPRIEFTNAQDPQAPELIRVRVHDPLSGPSTTRGSIGVRRAGSGDAFEPLPTEPIPTGLEASWESDDYGAGEYEFRGTGYDAAGNAATTTARANGTTMTLSNPIKAATVLAAGFDVADNVGRFDWRSSDRLVPFGRGARFSGRLITGLRTPLEGVGVRVIERFGSRERVSPARTGAGGYFSIALPPGESRKVQAIFEGTPTLTRAASRPLRLAVRGRVTLRASSSAAVVGGRPLVFRGRVAAEPGSIPAEGKSVELQFRLPGLPWSQFRTVRTDRRGRFRYAYRFSDDDSRGVRFRFRAHLPAQDDWPYEPGSSKPVAVRGL